jgi:succinate dehydrogenase/fumarate reductase flavoprotein subunit
MSTVRCDVAVVGSGAAGMNAALHAAMDGASTVILDKGAIGRSGASVQANVSTSAAPDGRWESHAADIIRTGEGRAKEDLAEILAREALVRMREWHAWGLRFHTDHTGDFARTWSRGHAEPRAISPGYGMGEKVCRLLRRRIMKETAIRALPYVSGVELLLDDGGITGLIAWDHQEARWVCIEAPSVVLATGGAQRLYPASTATAQLTGDGYAMAASVGAPLIDLEFVLFVPVALVWPRPIGISRTILEPIRKVGGGLRDRNGTSIVDDLNPDGDQASWEVLSASIELALRAGRGTDRRCLHFRADAAEQRAIAEVFPSILEKLVRVGIDLEAGVEVAPMAHFFPGGVEIDVHAESPVPGLFAAGEAAGGVHGATRLGGDALSAAAVFGARAGVSGSRRAQMVGPTRAAPTRLAKAHVSALVDRLAERGDHSGARMSTIQSIVGSALGPVRARGELADADATLGSMSASPWPLPRPVPGGNREFLTVLEVDSMERTAKAVLAAARRRTESKGSHVVVEDALDQQPGRSELRP